MDTSEVTASRNLVVEISPAARKYLIRVFAEIQEQATEVKAILECDFADVEGEGYGDLTMPEVIAQGRRGLRGLDALDAALEARARRPDAALAAQARKPGSTSASKRPVRAARPRERSSRRQASAGSRGSPGRSDDDPEPEHLACRRCACGCGRLVVRNGSRGPVPEAYDATCRKRIERQRNREGDLVRLLELACECADPELALSVVLTPPETADDARRLLGVA